MTTVPLSRTRRRGSVPVPGPAVLASRRPRPGDRSGGAHGARDVSVAAYPAVCRGGLRRQRDSPHGAALSPRGRAEAAGRQGRRSAGGAAPRQREPGRLRRSASRIVSRDEGAGVCRQDDQGTGRIHDDRARRPSIDDLEPRAVVRVYGDRQRLRRVRDGSRSWPGCRLHDGVSPGIRGNVHGSCARAAPAFNLVPPRLGNDRPVDDRRPDLRPVDRRRVRLAVAA